MIDPANPHYLGDGVYAMFDGYQVWLSTDREDGHVHSIALEPQVYVALQEYVELLKQGPET